MHSEDDAGTTTLEPTCTESGTITYTCTVCDKIYTETIPALGHNVVNEYCTVCNEKIAGLYDADGNLLCTWKESGIDVETDYSGYSDESNYYQTAVTSSYYVITNNYPTATKVVIPDNVTSIGASAFSKCTNLTSVTIPDSVTSIGDYAFQRCTGLTSITIGNGVTSIGECAFDECTNLSNVTIGNSVTSIGREVFFGCSKLTSITIPSSVTNIGYGVFDGCTNLTNATFKTTAGWYVGSSAGTKTTAISSSNLANTSTAATYLKTTYRDYYWTR